jgi:hypothetical protein
VDRVTEVADVEALSMLPNVDARVRILCPTGHLSYAPLRPDSFHLGLGGAPDYIVADAGSCDVGPAPLAKDEPTSPEDWQRFDLTEMLLGARRLGVPMIVGSASDAGTNAGVDRFVRLIREIAAEHDLPPFTLGYIYSEVAVDEVRRRLRSGDVGEGLDGRGRLTETDVDRTDRVVAVAGVHPYLELLQQGADVIIGGRSSDAALFAAPALLRGASPSEAYTFGKLLECASFAAEPYGGKESIMGTIADEGILVTAMNPAQRCTVASVAGHAMYERSSPLSEYFLGGHLDLTDTRYEQYDERTTLVTGSRFVADENPLRVKLEGAGRVGARMFALAGIRDPYTIANLDRAFELARGYVRERHQDGTYELYFHAYGRNGVMGAHEPVTAQPHEIGLVIEAIADDPDRARDVCTIAQRQLFYARLGEVKGTAGSMAFLTDEILRAGDACRWTINHTLPVRDPLELFQRHLVQVG